MVHKEVGQIFLAKSLCPFSWGLKVEPRAIGKLLMFDR